MLALSTTLVVPVLDGVSNLARLVPRLDALAAAVEGGPPLYVHFVDDGSLDPSWECIRSTASERPTFGGLRLDGRHGQHAALLSGALEARTEAVVTIDDDLKHPPEAIPALVAALAGGADLVYGTPRRRGAMGLRRLGSFAARTSLALRFRAPSGLSSSPFRAFRRELLGVQAERCPLEPNLDALLYASRPRVVSVRVEHAWPKDATSRYTWRSLARATAAVAGRGKPVDFRQAVRVLERAGVVTHEPEDALSRDAPALVRMDRSDPGAAHR